MMKEINNFTDEEKKIIVGSKFYNEQLSKWEFDAILNIEKILMTLPKKARKKMKEMDDYDVITIIKEKRIKARIIGTRGSIKKRIEKKTNCFLFFRGFKIFIFGEHIEEAITIIKKIESGKNFNYVF